MGIHDEELSPPANSDMSEFRNRSSGPSQAFRWLQPWPKSWFCLLLLKSVYLAALGPNRLTGISTVGEQASLVAPCRLSSCGPWA